MVIFWCGSTLRPRIATVPSTLTQPRSIHSSASRREASPSALMRLERRSGSGAAMEGRYFSRSSLLLLRPMLRLTEIKLPLDHAGGAVEAAILKRLEITPQDLVSFSVFRRAHDAR